MTNTTVKFGTSLTLDQAAEVILSTPNNRYFLQGEPGIGKSSLLKALSARLPEHEVAYIDCPNMDLGDIAMPVIDHEAKVTRYYPNSRFNMHKGKPIIAMYDEFTKAPQPVQNMLHPSLEVANPRLGDLPIHEDSIIFLTGNLASDGIGDNLKAHSRNRIIPLTISKPDAGQWLGWAVNNDIEPVVMAFVSEYPRVLASYTEDGQEDNPYIYNPRKPTKAFISPRSLERVSNIVRVRGALDAESVLHATRGAIGESGARDMQAFIDYQDQLPTRELIIRDPDNAPIPTESGACMVLIFNAVAAITKENIGSFMRYIERFDEEYQATFCISVAKNPNKQAIAFTSKAFTNWAARNEDLL